MSDAAALSSAAEAANSFDISNKPSSLPVVFDWPAKKKDMTKLQGGS
jgi:hypothetical protein